jgi:hypothetical protein
LCEGLGVKCPMTVLQLFAVAPVRQWVAIALQEDIGVWAEAIALWRQERGWFSGGEGLADGVVEWV